MEWERNVQINPNHLFVKEEKMRSFSTSTPFIGRPKPCKTVRSLSISAINTTNNDSGLGASLVDGSCTSSKFQDMDCDVTASFCTLTPFNKQHVPEIDLRHRQTDLIPSPVSSKSTNFARRSLDSCMGDSNERTPFEIQSHYGHDLGCVRRLNLDLDIAADTTPDVSEVQLSEQFNEVLSKFSPAVPSQLIGRRMGSESVDVLGELWGKNFPTVVSSILSLLDTKDLCRMCVVSRQWKTICEQDRPANSRRRHFLRKRHRRLRDVGKENLGKRSLSSVARDSQGTGVLQALTAVQRQCDPPPLENLCPPLSTADQFMQAAKCLKNDEKLQKCPKCRKPARVLPVQDRGQCQDADCGYDYCTRCLYSFHGSKDCVPIANKRQKTDCIGAKKSKKNLKRL